MATQILPSLSLQEQSVLSGLQSSWATLAMSVDWRTMLDLAKPRVYVFDLFQKIDLLQVQFLICRVSVCCPPFWLCLPQRIKGQVILRCFRPLLLQRKQRKHSPGLWSRVRATGALLCQQQTCLRGWSHLKTGVCLLCVSRTMEWMQERQDVALYFTHALVPRAIDLTATKCKRLNIFH